jgi:hypothetical protein
MTDDTFTAEQVGAWEARFGPLDPAERGLLLQGRAARSRSSGARCC